MAAPSTTTTTRDPKPTKWLVNSRQVLPILIACALTWSIGSMTSFFFDPLVVVESSVTILDPQQHAHGLASRKTQALLDQPLPEPSKKKIEYRQVHFLELNQDLEMMDLFSATWLQPLKNFLKTEVPKIKTVEDGCFQAFWKNQSAVRMTLDWLDFSVEHMSKWWKVADIFGKNAVPFNKAVTSFQAYTRDTRTQLDIHKLSPLKETFAIIAFQPYNDWRNKTHPRAKPLTVSSLAVTMASLLRVGFGRVVVAGVRDTDRDFVYETFRYLKDTLDSDSTTDHASMLNHSLSVETPPITNIGPMEVGYVQLRPEECKTKFIDANIPKGAIYVLQHAFKGDLDPKRIPDVLGTTTDKSYWKYIFLTEPDTILQTKPWVLPQLKNALDQGLVLSPHRLQPLPHESDLMGMDDEHRYVKSEGNFTKIIDLDAEDGAVCCDEQKKTYKPYTEYFGSCGYCWWECGFKQAGNWSHSGLKPYSLMRLKQGTGIISLAATAHGRRCFPNPNGMCLPLSNKVSLKSS